MEYDLTFKMKEILTYAIIWGNFENIMPIEIIKSQNAKCCMIPLIWGLLSRKIHGMAEKRIVAWAGGKGSKEAVV
jgi:hypothetical protein